MNLPSTWGLYGFWEGQYSRSRSSGIWRDHLLEVEETRFSKVSLSTMGTILGPER